MYGEIQVYIDINAWRLSTDRVDPIKNPFSPGAGSPPPELVGRSGILEQARILLGRVKERRPEKSILLTGLRGVGKTVLLNEMERLAGKAAEERQIPVALLIDELQYFKPKELSALIMAMHKMQQDQLPMVLLGAGLPILPGLVGESKSYAERLFSFPDIGALSEPDAGKALNDPTRAAGVEFESAALTEIFRLTQGYPYFLQEWGYQSWNRAVSSPITLQVVQEATATVIRRLDENFFRVRFDRLTPGERRFLRAMAGLGPGAHRSGDIADALGLKLSSLGPARAKLIRKGMIYNPVHGDMAFTVPLFDEFMLRAMQ
jgi:hypothetical protein